MNKEESIEMMNLILSKLGMTPTRLAKALGMERAQVIYDVLSPNKKVGISKNLAAKIVDRFPQFNLSFILTGKGDMLIARDVINGQDFDNVANGQEKALVKLIPLLPISAEGGTLSRFFDTTMLKECKMVQSHVDDAQFAMFVTGDSMAPEYPAGSIIFIKYVKEKSFIEWGRVYVVDTCNGSVIKKLMPSDDGSKDKIKCVSINSAYPPFEVPFGDICGIYRVRACTSLK